MSTRQIQTKAYIVWLVANAHSSLMYLQLEHGLKIECIPYDDLINTIGMLRQIPAYEVHSQLFGENMFVPQNELSWHESERLFSDTYSVAIHSSANVKINYYENGGYSLASEFISEAEVPFHELDIYLDLLFKKLRIYKESRICSICSFCSIDTPGGIKLFSYSRKAGCGISELYRISCEEVKSTNSFIEKYSLPVYELASTDRVRGIAISYQNFELAFKVLEPKSSFILLITALENLVNISIGTPPTLLKNKLNTEFYNEFKEKIVCFLNEWQFEDEEINRLKNQILSTHAKSITSHVYSYFKSFGMIEFTEDNIKLWYDFRNRLSHGKLVDTVKLQSALTSLRSALREALKHEILRTTES